MSLLGNKFNTTKVVKCKLKSIIRKDKYAEVIKKLTDIGVRINKLVIYNYQFMRAYILYHYETYSSIPVINKKFIKMSFQILMNNEKKLGPPIKGDNLILLEKLKKFYDTYKDKLGITEKISGLNLSQIIEYMSVTMLTAIENNIKLHFIVHLKTYIRNKFQFQYNKIKCISNKEERSLQIKKFKNDLKTIETDLIENKNNSDVKYRLWINETRRIALPNDIKTSLYYDLNADPQKYMYHMIRMNRYSIGQRMLQFFPLRTEKVIGYFPLDTKSIIEILYVENKKQYLDNIFDNKENIWKEYFNLDHKNFKSNNYEFDFMVYTNTYTVSVLFLHKSVIEKVNMNKQNKIKGLKKFKEQFKEESKESYKEKIKILEEKEKNKMDYKLNKIKEKEDYKLLSKAEKNKITKERKDKKEEELKKKKEEYDKLSEEEKTAYNLKEEKRKRNMQPEFVYLEELTELQIEELKDKTLIYIDPGKIRLLTMMNDDGIILKYTNKQRIRETKRLVYLKKLEKFKNEKVIEDIELVNNEPKKILKSIIDIESELTNYKSKSCILSTFLDYVQKKNETNNKLFSVYENSLFTKLQWYLYINKQRSEQKLINNIKQKFGINIVLMMGDWSVSKQMRNFISTPMIGLRKMLLSHFDVINIDEYNTSALNHKTEEKTKNLHIHVKKKVKGEKKKTKQIQKSNKNKQKNKSLEPEINNIDILNINPINNTASNSLSLKQLFINKDKSVGYYKLHSVLTYKMENNRLGCINRDRNAVLNMKKIVVSWLTDRTRPEKFRRGKVQSSNDTPKIVVNHF
jgi:hypothetical protein